MSSNEKLEMGAEQAPQKTPEKKHTFLKIFLALCIVGFIGALVCIAGLSMICPVSARLQTTDPLR